LRPTLGDPLDESGNCISFGCYCDPHPSGWWGRWIDITCDYQYYGTANATVDVEDVRNEYPIDSEWTELKTAFHIVSGNQAPYVGECSGEAETSICCPAITTNELDEASGCKTGT